MTRSVALKRLESTVRREESICKGGRDTREWGMFGDLHCGPMLPEYKCRRGMAKMGAQEIGKEEEV